MMGAARMSNTYFVNADVAEVATCALAEFMGGAMEVSKTPTTSGASAAPAQNTGGNFYILVILMNKRHLEQALFLPQRSQL